MESIKIKVESSQIFDRFKNGRERYYKSPLFHSVIKMLERGDDPYNIIDKLCQMHDDLMVELGVQVESITPKIKVDLKDWCKGCVRDIPNLSMNDTCIDGVWASPYEQKIFAAKCPEGSCKHDGSGK
jgi:hypothetical protein